MAGAKTAIILDNRRIKKNGTFPVKLRITFDRKQKYFPTPYELTEVGFQTLMYGARLSEKDKTLKKRITAFENKALDIIEKLPTFTWQAFEKYYHTNRSNKDTLNAAFSDYCRQLRKDGRIGTAVSYECAQNSLNKFSPEIKLAEISPDFLRRYEKWMLSKDNSVTTVGIYLRSLRTIFNVAISEDLIPVDLYPFGKRKYEIPTSSNTKKTLSMETIGAIFYFKAKAYSTPDMAKDFWLFMYFCNGINCKDMCLLKYQNIKGDILEFERAKTVRTKRKVELIRVNIGDELTEIIQKWGNKDRKSGNYIFDVLSKGLTPERERQLIQQRTRLINDHMKIIAQELQIGANITTYAARHSFATILQRSGVSTEFISEALGHSNVKTTQNYLAGFEDEKKKEIVKALSAFKFSNGN